MTQYRLQVGRGVASDELAAANQSPFLIRIMGNRLPPATGTPDAINLTDYSVTRVNTCS